MVSRAACGHAHAAQVLDSPQTENDPLDWIEPQGGSEGWSTAYLLGTLPIAARGKEGRRRFLGSLRKGRPRST
jgi:hypothetical protein